MMMSEFPLELQFIGEFDTIIPVYIEYMVELMRGMG